MDYFPRWKVNNNHVTKGKWLGKYSHPIRRIWVACDEDFEASHPSLGGSSQDLVQWLITMVIVGKSPKDRVVGPLPNGHSCLLNGGDPITTETSVLGWSSKVGIGSSTQDLGCAKKLVNGFSKWVIVSTPILPGKLTCPLIINVWKMYFLLK